MRFCTVINCMDGRVQLPVIMFLRKRFNAPNVDTITEPGPNLTLSEQKNHEVIESIIRRVRISVMNHDPVGLAIAGHHGCIGNPADKDEQIVHTQNAIQLIRNHVKGIDIIGLWVNDRWDVEEIT